MQLVVLTELGIAVLDGPRCAKSFPFADPAAEYMAVRRGEANLDALVRHAESLDTGVLVSDAALLEALRSKSVEAQLAGDADMARVRADKPQILVDAGFASGHEDAVAKLRDFAMGLSSAKVGEASQSPDAHIIQAIRTMDEIDRTLNAHNSRLREWYGLHFPELENVVDGIAGYARIAALGRRSDISAAALEQSGLEPSSAEMVALLASKSRGGDIADESLAMVRALAESVTGLSERRGELEDHVTAQMGTVAPNTAAILGALIGARMMAHAGSLSRLATMPASSIQVLGAEKALFRSLKTGARPPKHGLLFQHQLVHAAPRWQRGKMARAIASKAAIAARVDVYGEGLNETLLEKLKVRVGEIGTEKQPPPRPERRQERGEGRGPQAPPRRRFKGKPKGRPKRRFDRRPGLRAR